MVSFPKNRAPEDPTPKTRGPRQKTEAQMNIWHIIRRLVPFVKPYLRWLQLDEPRQLFEMVWEEPRDSGRDAVPIGNVQVRGREQPIQIYQIV